MTIDNTSTLPLYLDCEQFLPPLSYDENSSSSWKSTFESELESISDQLLTKVNNFNISSDHDFSVYSGIAGVAYFFWRLTQCPVICSSPQFAHKLESWKKAAKISIDTALNIVERDKESGAEPGGSGGAACCIGTTGKPTKCSTLLTGHAGVYAVASVIYRDLDIDKSKHFVRSVLDFAPDLNANDRLPCGIMNGIAGFLSCLIFMNKHSMLNLTQSSERLVAHKLVIHVLLRGRLLAMQNSGNQSLPLLWQYRGDQHTGAALGISGILTVLLYFHTDIRKAGYDKRVREAISGLFSARMESGNLPISLNGPKKDVFVQWCQGVPGFVPLIAIAMKVYPQNIDIYKNYISEVMSVIMEKGLVSKGFGICHGISGNAFSLLCAYRECKVDKYDLYAKRFTLFACKPEGDNGADLKKKLISKPDHPLSLMEGVSGLGCLLTYFFENEQSRNTFCNGGCPWLM